jgi:hypothetical protein
MTLEEEPKESFVNTRLTHQTAPLSKGVNLENNLIEPNNGIGRRWHLVVYHLFYIVNFGTLRPN